jgi:hypothetical protein
MLSNPSSHSSSENSRPALSRDLDFVAMKPSCFQNFSTVALLVTTQGLFHALEGLHAVMHAFSYVSSSRCTSETGVCSHTREQLHAVMPCF